MEPAEVERAAAAGRSAAAALGLAADDAVVVHASNRIAVRVVPGDVLVRAALPRARDHMALEVEVAAALTASGAPVAGPDPRVAPVVHEHDGFVMTFWTWHEPVVSPELTAADYASTLLGLHAGLRLVDVPTPRFTDRVAEAQAAVADRKDTTELPDGDRALLVGGLALVDGLRGGREQVLHGEPHVGNLLRTAAGLLVIDFETVCRGPVEFDLAHSLLPSAEGRHLASAAELCAAYPGADPTLVARSQALIWAMITTWRWQGHDRLPNRDHWRHEGLRRLRAALDG